MRFSPFFSALFLLTSIFIVSSTPIVAMEEEDKTLSNPGKSTVFSTPIISSEEGHSAEGGGAAAAASAGESTSFMERDSLKIHHNKETDPGYNSDNEYKRHQSVNEQFFRRLSYNESVRESLLTLTSEMESASPLTPINLDGFSSRTRILLFRELTALKATPRKHIPFVLHGKSFEVILEPSLRQPGNGIVTTIGKYENISKVFDACPPQKQQEIATKLLQARRSKSPYHPPIPNPILKIESEDIDLEILNFLLDFEVARRLQVVEEGDEAYFEAHLAKEDGYLDWALDAHSKGEFLGGGERFEKATRALSARDVYPDFVSNIDRNSQEKRRRVEGVDPRKFTYIEKDKSSYDAVPVASAIVGALKLSGSENPSPLPLKSFFHAPSIAQQGTFSFRYGDFNAFEGLPSFRKSATKRIIRELRGGRAAKNSSREDIHQEFLEVFGGASESEGEEY